MPDSLETIKKLYDSGDLNDKLEYLFQGIQAIDKNMKLEFAAMRSLCSCREEGCKKSFVSKTQARLFGIALSILVLGIGLGAGWITFNEVLKMAGKGVLP